MAREKLRVNRIIGESVIFLVDPKISGVYCLVMTAIEQIRRLRGMTNTVAKECGVSASTVSGWEQVPAHHIETVARLLAMTPAEVRPDLAAVLRGGEMECR